MAKSNTISTANRLRPSHIRQALLAAIRCHRPTFVHGPPGIGKSEIVWEIATEQNRPVIDLRLLLLEPTDLRGIPYYDPVAKQMVWAPPDVLPRKDGPLANAILFLDELNAAPPSVQAAAYQLILNRKVGNYELPAGVDIVAAGNRETDRGVTYRMPSPLANRFLHLEMEPNFTDWQNWAIKQSVHRDVIGFLSYRNDNLFNFDPKNSEKAFATPRTWMFTSDLLHKEENLSDYLLGSLIGGCIGDGLGSEFMTYRRTAAKLPNPMDILTGKVTSLKLEETSTIYSLVVGLCYSLNDISKRLVKDDKEAKRRSLEEERMYVTNKTFHEYGDNFFKFLMDSVSPEMAILGARTSLGIHHVPFEHNQLTEFKRFYAKFRQYLDNDA